MTAISLLTNALVPAALFILAGVALRRRLGVDLRPLSRVALYVLSPSLVIYTLASPGLSWRDGLGIALYAGLMVLIALAIARVVATVGGVTGPEQGALSLAAVFPNSANLGLPIVTLALGRQSVAAAVVFVLTQIVLINTVGAYVASRARLDPRTALRRIVGLPALWAMGLSIGLVSLHGRLPDPVATAAHLGADAYAPTVLLVLGGALAEWTPQHLRRLLSWIAAALRLLVMPLVGVAVAAALALRPAVAAALVLQTSMPMAVNTLVLAQEFDAGAEQVAATVGLTTLVGVLTVPFWLLWLAHGRRP